MEETTEAKKSNVSIPIAIVVAGILIAGAVFINKTPSMPSKGATDGVKNASVQIEFKPVTASEHVLGKPSAELLIIEYSDFECPFCKQFHTTLQRIMNQYGKEGDVAWVYRQFPLVQLHPKAPKEAEATECAAEAGGNTAFWAFTDKLFEVTPSNNGLDLNQLPKIAKEIGLNEETFSACLSSGKHANKVNESYKEAVAAGGQGTPFTIFVPKGGISNSMLLVLQNAISQLPAGTITISSDKKSLSMSGALPYDFVSQLVEQLLPSKFPAAGGGLR